MPLSAFLPTEQLNLREAPPYTHEVASFKGVMPREKNMNLERSERVVIPVLPLRDVVVYPHMVIPLFVGREKSIRCLEAAMEQEKRILLVAQKEAATDRKSVV